MPELPEIETLARGLRRAWLGSPIESVELRRGDIYRGPDPAVLSGSVVRTLDRAGKYLIAGLRGAGGDWQLMFHLGMTGQLLWVPASAPLASHTHAILYCRDGRQLHFRDPRRFGRIALALAPPSGWAPGLGIPPGHEPLEVKASAFVDLFHRRQAPIKNALLNQKLLRGVGNIYADEALFRAGIDPRARALSRPRLLRLRLALRAVLRQAVAAGGSSISDYLNSDGEPGWFHFQHRVYGREGQPCLRCRTPIRRVVLAGRSAHFCPSCQVR